MEEKDFNELLFEEKKNPKNIKNIILGAIGVVVVLIIILLAWSFTRNSHDIMEHSETIQPEQILDNTKTPEAIEDDRFDQIMQNIRNNDQNTSSSDTLASQEASAVHENHYNLEQETMTSSTSQEIMPNDQFHTALDLKNETKEQELTTQSQMTTLPQEEVPTLKEEKASTTQQNKIEQKQTKKQVKKTKTNANSRVATKGSYLQVGVFSKKPSKELLAMLKKHPYKTQEITINEQKLTKYLVGPFKSRSEASKYKEENPELNFSVYFEVK